MYDTGVFKKAGQFCVSGLLLCVILFQIVKTFHDAVILPVPFAVQTFGHPQSLEENIRKKAALTNLNQLKPDSFDGLVQFLADRRKKDFLKPYVAYYEKMAEYGVGGADVYGLLGFFYYGEGDSAKAMAAYREAIKRNPYFFWFYHNLGLIYFNQKQYDKAIKVLQAATAADPDVTLKTIRKEKIYIPVMLETDVNSDYKILKKMKI